jgi:hypothetical protein
LLESIAASKARLAALNAARSRDAINLEDARRALAKAETGSSNLGIAPGRLSGGGRTEVS